MTRLDIPSLVVIVSSSDVLEETEVWGSLKEAVQRTMRLRAQPQSKEGGRAGGISAIVLRQDGADEKTGAQRLYDAGILAQSFLDSSGKGIPLILRGRPDVASACECTGVLLKESDIPTVAAKRILTDGRALVLREVRGILKSNFHSPVFSSLYLLLELSLTHNSGLAVRCQAQRMLARMPRKVQRPWF